MYTINNAVYSDAGKILVTDKLVGYKMSSKVENIVEEDITLDDMEIKSNFLVYSNGRIHQYYNSNFDYGCWKSYIIKIRYSPEEQLALILNKDNSDEDLLRFNKMQEWRDWASKVAKKIMSLK